jgi:hypothetical protein
LLKQKNVKNLREEGEKNSKMVGFDDGEEKAENEVLQRQYVTADMIVLESGL